MKNGAIVDDTIGKNLTNIIAVCRLLKAINENTNNDQSLIKNYERIGDLCVNIECYDTANFYHFVHTLALLGVPLTKRPVLVSSTNDNIMQSSMRPSNVRCDFTILSFL